MKLITYLSFGGNCATAFQFYEKALGGHIAFIMTYGESPMAGEVPPDWGTKVMHASLTVGDALLMGADAPPDRQHNPHGFCVNIATHDPAEAERVFAALAEGGQVQMSLSQTFWALRFGMLLDQFGIPWMVNCEEKK